MNDETVVRGAAIYGEFGLKRGLVVASEQRVSMRYETATGAVEHVLHVVGCGDCEDSQGFCVRCVERLRDDAGEDHDCGRERRLRGRERDLRDGAATGGVAADDGVGKRDESCGEGGGREWKGEGVADRSVAINTGIACITGFANTSIACSVTKSIVNTVSEGIAVNAIPGIAVNAITGIAVSAIPGIAVNAITGIAVSAITGIAVNAIPGIAVNAITGIAVNAITGIAVNAITGIAVSAITGIAVNAITGIAISAIPSIASKGIPSIAEQRETPPSIPRQPGDRKNSARTHHSPFLLEPQLPHAPHLHLSSHLSPPLPAYASETALLLSPATPLRHFPHPRVPTSPAAALAAA